jgi:hypothetical protein
MDGESEKKPIKYREMHLQSFFQVGLSKLEADERRKRLFELEDERDQKIMEEIIRKQRELEDRELEHFRRGVESQETEKIREELKLLEEERKLLELKREDRKTNHIGKKVLGGEGSGSLYVGGEAAASNLEWISSAGIKAVVNVSSNIKHFFEEGMSVVPWLPTP